MEKHCSTSCANCRIGKLPGVLHIFNHQKFDEKLNLEERMESKFDVNSLKTTFGIYCLKIFVHPDFPLKKIKRKITEISKTDYSENSSIVVVFLTHGFQNNVIAAKDTFYCLKDKILKIQSNKTLESKTKLFIIQACRLDEKNRLYSKYNKPKFAIKPENLKETIILNSSSEFSTSYRLALVGTPLIKIFCNYLKEFGFKLPIGEIIDLVIISVQNLVNQLPEINRNTNAKYIFGDYVPKQAIKSSSKLNAETEKIEKRNQILFIAVNLFINKLTEINDDRVRYSIIKDLSELVSPDDNKDGDNNNIAHNANDQNANDQNANDQNAENLNDNDHNADGQNDDDHDADNQNDDDDDDDLNEPIQNIIEYVAAVQEYAQENDQIIINEKAERFIAKFKSEDVDQWVQVCPCGHTQLPDNLVFGGTDIDGDPLYIGRAIFKYDLLPAKVSIKRRHAFVSHCYYEHKITDFEVLTGTGYSWKPGTRGSVPENAVRGGMACDGEILYIGRTTHDTTITPGKIHPSHKCLYVPFDGAEISFFHYEVLVKSN